MSDGDIAKRIGELFDLRPYSIVKRFGLKNPIFLPTASYGHFGRTPYKKEVEIIKDGKPQMKEVEFFTWEKLDRVEDIRKAFAI